MGTFALGLDDQPPRDERGPAAAAHAPAGAAGRMLGLLADVTLGAGGSLDPRAALAGAVEAIAAVCGQAEVEVYLLDEERQQLVLAAGTAVSAELEQPDARVPVGEGPIGRAAASGETHVLRGGAPGGEALGESGEPATDGLLCVPIAAGPDRLLGVVAVRTPDGDPPGEERRELVEWSAGLVGRALETAQRHAAVARRAAALQQVGKVSAVATAGLPTSRVLAAIAELARGACAAELAVLVVPNPTGADNLVLTSLGATLSGEQPAVAELVGRELVDFDARVRRGGAGWAALAEDVTARLRPWLDVAATVPLRMAGEELGVLCCYRAKGRLPSDEHQAVLATIANHAALALKAAMLAEEVVEHNEFGRFLRDIVAGRLDASALREHAAALGLGASSTYTFVVGSVAFEQRARDELEREARVLGYVAHRLSEIARDARSVAGAHEVVAMVPSRPTPEWLSGLRATLAELRGALRERAGARMTFGVSRATGALEDVRATLTEAREAMAIGAGVGGSGVFTLDDVSHHLLLRRAADVAPVRDRYSAAVEVLAEHDRVRNGALLHTLSVFLHLRNRSHAARALYVHRNTLGQRLRRIQELTRVDVTDAEEWFPLQLALKIHLLRESRV